MTYCNTCENECRDEEATNVDGENLCVDCLILSRPVKTNTDILELLALLKRRGWLGWACGKTPTEEPSWKRGDMSDAERELLEERRAEREDLRTVWANPKKFVSFLSGPVDEECAAICYGEHPPFGPIRIIDRLGTPQEKYGRYYCVVHSEEWWEGDEGFGLENDSLELVERHLAKWMREQGHALPVDMAL